MLTSLCGRCIGLSTVVCVLLLFFFPLAHGNFQSTHGPVTALRAKRNVVLLFFSMLMAALQISGRLISAMLIRWRDCLPQSDNDLGFLNATGSPGVLRC